MLIIIALILLIVFLCFAISMMSSSTKANRLAHEKLRLESQEADQRRRGHLGAVDAEFEQKWEIMSRYEPEVRAQVERLEPHGLSAIEELKRVYRATGDKSRITDFADQIMADIESGKLDLSRVEADSVAGGAGSTAVISNPGSGNSSPMPMLSLVFALLAVVFPLFSPVAVVIGHLALRKLGYGESEKQARYMTYIGLTVGYLIILIWVIMLLMISLG